MLLCLIVLLSSACCLGSSLSNHTNNWAVLVDTSRFWFNYRHAANVFSLYRTVRRLGIPDSRIILMVADVMACDAQNPFPAQVFNDEGRSANIYGTRVEVDYRGAEVTAEALMRVLTGRHAPEVPVSKRLLTDEGSNVLIYLTGHGGDEFFKLRGEKKESDCVFLSFFSILFFFFCKRFQDAGEISSFDLADAFHSMHQKARYHEMLVIADTCQANTLYERLYSPDICMVGSSQRGESSWSKGTSAKLGTTMVDRFTDATLRFFERHATSDPSLLQLLRSFDPSAIDSHPGWVSHLARPLDRVPVSDFFAARESRLVMEPAPAGPVPNKKNEKRRDDKKVTTTRETTASKDNKASGRKSLVYSWILIVVSVAGLVGVLVM
jgi:phosphatidylinositol glycan class K